VAYEVERQVAVEAVAKACRLCEAVRQGVPAKRALSKKDRSPVTVADFGSQALICRSLAQAFGRDPVAAEEDSTALRSEAGAATRAMVIQHVAAIWPGLSDQDVLDAIDRGGHEGGATGRFWALDPVDGTKGFLRDGQYAVALALIEDGVVKLAVLGCLRLPAGPANPAGPRGRLFLAVRGQGAMERGLDHGEWEPVKTAPAADPAGMILCESVEPGHSSHADAARVAELMGARRPPLRMDSQCKYAAVARGDATAYLRLPTRPDYFETVWDHAAGSLVVTEAGGRVTDVRGRELVFSAGRRLKFNGGIVASNGALHSPLLAAVKQALQEAKDRQPRT